VLLLKSFSRRGSDRFWHPGLVYKLRFLPTSYYLVIQSFLNNRYFKVLCDDAFFEYHSIKAGISKAPTLYNIYTSDIPHNDDTIFGTYADDTGIIASDPIPNIASFHSQNYLCKLQSWFIKWRIKINELKSSHITFSLRPRDCPLVYINNKEIPPAQSVKYLGM